MRSILIAASLLAVVLAGCSDDPPAGELTGSSVAVPVAGTVTLDEQTFSEPQPSSGDGTTCPQRDTLQQQQCTYPYTKLNIHLMSMPDPQSGTYTAMLASSSGATMDLGALEVNGTAPNMMFNLDFDNEGDCAGTYSDEGCVLSLTYDEIHIYLDDLLVGMAPLQSGASFVANPNFGGHAFVLSYEGKSATVELSGNGNFTYELVLYTADETGEVSAVENYVVSVGSNEVTAEMDFDAYAEAHIHVAGTKVNLAKASA